jgi:hypothetical protein
MAADWFNEFQEYASGVLDVVDRGLEIRDRALEPAYEYPVNTPPISETQKPEQVEETTAPAGFSAHPLLIAGGLLLVMLLISEID